MTKKKICFVTALPTSARSFLKEPIKKLKQDFEIHYVGNFDSFDEVSDLGADCVTPIRIERKPNISADLKALWKLYRHFRKQKYFAIHAITRKASLLSGIAAFCARTPHRIKTFTGQIWATMSGKKRYFYRMLDRLDVIINTELLVDGESQRRYLIDEHIMKEPDAKVLANGSICGVDTNRFSPSNEVRADQRNKLNLKEDEVVFIFLGRLKREKGIYELYEAFNSMYPDCPSAKLLLVGTDEECCESHLSDYPNLNRTNVIFYGATKTPEKLLQAGDVFVLPTYREGFGLAALEAACVGLPVICSDTYGVMDAMIDDKTGLRCKTKDSESLEIAMRRLYKDANLRGELGNNGRNRVINDFSREVVTEAWLEFYRNLK